MSMKMAYLKHKSINDLRPATRKLRDNGNVAENMDGRRRSGFEGSNTARASRSYGIDDDKFSMGKHGGRWNSKSSTRKTKPHFGGKTDWEEQEWKNESPSLATGYKRKRVYAEREEGPHGRRGVEWYDAKHGSNPKRGDAWGSQKNDGRRNNSLQKFHKSEFELSNHHGRGAVEWSHSKHRNNSKTIDLRSSYKNDNERNDSLKKFSTNIRESSEEYDPSQKEPAAASVLKPSQRLGRDRKQLADKPKSRKRVFRMIPNDISNKRLLDNIEVDIDITQEIKEDPEKKLSFNAQFRAIKPSPSILSFVEDNLIGRRRSIQLQRAGYNIDLSSPLDNMPLSTSNERQRIEEPVFRNKLTFFAAAKISSSFPPANLPEIAFAGRSNVGKSSLLNALTRQWGVVRTSDKPGLTQTINFFSLEKKLCLVDLPGYGFAYAKEEVKHSWEELVKEYVSTRVGLNQVCLLIDTKWGMKPRDNELINLMERSRTRYQIVLTKTDAVFPIDVARRAMQIEERLKGHKSVIRPAMMVSAKSGAGIGMLRKVLAKVPRLVKV